MSFVPVTGPATFRAADPPRESVVEFSDERRTVALPIRAALPVLTKAHPRDDLHPSVGLLSGAALLGLRLVAGGKLRPDGGPGRAGGWRRWTPTTPTACSGSRRRGATTTRWRPRSWSGWSSTPSPTRCPAPHP